jgi:hypothetical protein
VHEAFRALTRLAEPGVMLVCLHETAQGIALEPDGKGAPLDISKRPNLGIVQELLKRAVNVQRRDVVDYYINNVHTSARWRNSAAVRYHIPVVFGPDGFHRPEGASFALKLTRELGLEVIQEAK